jgi:hypothetical protein
MGSGMRYRLRHFYEQWYVLPILSLGFGIGLRLDAVLVVYSFAILTLAGLILELATTPPVHAVQGDSTGTRS